MKKITDYVFYNSWQLAELNIKPREKYIVLANLCDLKRGEVIQFVGFDDVDNHYGIFVFTNTSGAVLEVTGDFSSCDQSRLKELKNALSKV